MLVRSPSPWTVSLKTKKLFEISAELPYNCHSPQNVLYKQMLIYGEEINDSSLDRSVFSDWLYKHYDLGNIQNSWASFSSSCWHYRDFWLSDYLYWTTDSPERAADNAVVHPAGRWAPKHEAGDGKKHGGATSLNPRMEARLSHRIAQWRESVLREKMGCRAVHTARRVFCHRRA